MPVFTRVRDGVLLLTVDGDYTPNELRRVGVDAFQSEEISYQVPVLLDLSGAAGLANKTQEDLSMTGAILGAYHDRVTGIAVVAPPDVSERFGEGSDFAQGALVPVNVCASHAEAHEWLQSHK